MMAQPGPKHDAGAVAAAGVEPEAPKLFAVLAEFENPGQIMKAAEQVRDAGFKKWDCHTPFPVHGLDKAMGIRMTKLPILVFCCGFTGMTLGILMQWFMNAAPESLTLYLPMDVTGYPYIISGKPEWSLAANIPVIFELTILLSAFGAVFGMIAMNGLPRFYHPVFKSERFRRVTQDRFFISIEAEDPRFEQTEVENLLRRIGAVSVETVED